MMLGKRWGHRVVRWATLAAVGSAAVGVIAKVLPWFAQDNWMFVGFLTPVWVTLALASRRWPFDARVAGKPASEVRAENAE
jgi:hypothetical protein